MNKFLQRLKLLTEKTNAHQKEIFEKYVNQEANMIEKQMAVQRRLDIQSSGNETNENMEGKNVCYLIFFLDLITFKHFLFKDFCLPAVFMPFKSPSNVYNPRAYQYFHPSGKIFRV